MTATGVSTIGAWIYPGSTLVNGQSDVSNEISANATSMNHTYDRLHPQYYHCNGSGVLVQDTVASSGVDGYSVQNAAAIKAACKQAFVTIAGGAGDITALAGSTTLQTNFNNTLVSFCQTSGFAGVEFDIEGSVTSSGAYANYKQVAFSTGTALHNASLKLACSLPGIYPSTQGSYALNYADFNDSRIDYVTIQCYDAWGDAAGWGVGAGGPSGLAMQMPNGTLTSICNYLATKISDQTKIIIGVTQEGAYGTSGTYTVPKEALTYLTMSAYPGFSGAVRDSNSGEMYWSNGGNLYNYGDSTTLNQKLSTILNSNLTIANIIVWFLGGQNKWFTGMTFVSSGGTGGGGTGGGGTGGGGTGGGTVQVQSATGGSFAAYASQDSFATRTVAAGSTFGTSSDGETWAAINGTNYQLSVANNEGNALYTGSGPCTVDAILGSQTFTNEVVTARFSPLALSGTSYFGLYARYTAGTSYYLARITMIAGAGASTLSLCMYNGSFNILKSVTYTLTAGTYYRLKLLCNNTVVGAKIWVDGALEPMNWSVQKENFAVSGSGLAGMYFSPTGTSAAAGISVDSYGVAQLTSQGKFDYFYDLSNWIVAAAIDGTGITAPIYANSTAYANGYINLRGGTKGGMDLRADSSGGTANIVYLQTVRNFTLPGTFAWQVTAKGPIYAPGNYLRSVKALYTAGGDQGANNHYIETDFELCSEGAHPFASPYPNTPNPFVICFTYSAADGSVKALPSLPIDLTNVWNDPLILAQSFVVYATTASLVTYKVDYYMKTVLSSPNYIYIGSTLTQHDISVTYTEAFIDLHYLSVSGQLAANPLTMGVDWFYFSPAAGDLP